MIEKVKRIDVQNGNGLSISPVKPVAMVNDLNVESVLDAAGRVIGTNFGEVVTKITKDEIIVQITVG